MKLIYIANARIPTERAHGVQIMEMCAAFSRNGCGVELLVPRRLNRIKDNPFHYYGLLHSFKIVKLPCLSLDFIYFDFGKIGFFIQTITFLISARIYLLFKKYDILYTREQLIYLFFRNFILELHGLPRKVGFIHRKIWNKAKHLVVLTSFIKDELISERINEEKVLVSPDGVNLERFTLNIDRAEARKKVGLPMDKKIILYSGSFYSYDWKGVDILLEVSKYLSGDCLVVLVGEYENKLAEMKDKYKSGKIILLGQKSYAEVPDYLKSADVLVLPNKKGDAVSEKYTSPLKLFEYMASGTPIVASNLPSIKEILNENNAVLVEPNNPEALAFGIKRVLKDGEFSAKILKQALKDVQNYTWDKRARTILNFTMKLPGGWFKAGDIAAYRELVSNIPRGGQLLELGSWKGRSICSVAQLLIERDIKVSVVDTFRGTDSESEGAHKEAKLIDLKQVFINNTKNFGIDDRITIIQDRTDDVVKSFKDKTFDLVFVDADHQEESVFKDINNYRSKVKDGGTIAGHDWKWESVRKAIVRTGLQIITIGNMWYCINPHKKYD